MPTNKKSSTVSRDDSAATNRLIAICIILALGVLAICFIAWICGKISDSGITSILPSGWFWWVVLIGGVIWLLKKINQKKGPHGASLSESMKYWYGQADKKFGWIMPIVSVIFIILVAIYVVQSIAWFHS